MKIFISSLISGMEDYRAAAKEAVMQLGHDAVMAEDFGARANSPQIACLDGLRQSGLVILILGADYGSKQGSGFSATHEEYKEAKGSRPVIGFVQQGVSQSTKQQSFVKEVQAWESGLFRGGFNSAESLKSGIIRAIHEWQLSTAVGPLNADELKRMAIAAVAEEQTGRSGRSSLILAFIGGPLQSVLRPSEIEKKSLSDELLQYALFGPSKLFSTDTGNKSEIERDSLVLQQEERTRLIKLEPQGGIVFRLKIEETGHGMVVIKEHLEKYIISAIKYAAWVLDKIDPTQRLSHIAIATAFSERSVLIRTQAEHNSSPNSFSMGYSMGNDRSEPVTLKPAHRGRAALSHEAEILAEDLVTLLKRGSGNR